MLCDMRQKFFGDIIPQDRLTATFVSVAEPEVDFNDVMWDAAFGREKRSSKKVSHDVIAEDYVFDEVDYTKIRANKRLSRRELNELMDYINS